MITRADHRVLSPSPELSDCCCPPDNSEFRKIGEDVLDAMKLVLCSVAANPAGQPRCGTLEAAFHEALRSMKDERREQYATAARRLLAAEEDLRSRVFGRYGALRSERVLEQGFDALLEAAGPVRIDPKLLGMPPAGRKSGPLDIERLERVWGPRTVAPASHLFPPEAGMPPLRLLSGQPDPEVPFPGYFRKLEFKVDALRCVDETNPEVLGHDEISIGGVATHTLGQVTKIGAKTYEDFDDNNTEHFDPPWIFASFEKPKPKSGEWIYDTYSVLIALAEVDHGGFGKFLDEIYAKTKEKILLAIAAAVFAGATPFVGPYVAAIAAAVAAWAVNKFIEWVISWFQDDLFPPRVATITGPRGFGLYLPDQWIQDGPSFRSKVVEQQFYGAGGHYEVDTFWRVSEFVAGSAPQ